MFDQETTALAQVASYPQPRIRVSANYPATDGSCPEHLEVEIFDTEGFRIDQLIAEAVRCLAAVTTSRYPAGQDATKADAAAGRCRP